MKYSDLSDFEINKKAFLLGVKLGYFDFEDIMKNKNPNCNAVMYGDGLNWHKWDGCSRAKDSWPIIVTNEISIIRDVSTNDVWEALPKGWITMNGFESSIDNKLSYIDKNPLRAAMIVFLMMNEGKTQ